MSKEGVQLNKVLITEKSYDLNKRTPQDIINQEFTYFKNASLLTMSLDLTGTSIMILNETRQLVYANNNLLRLLNVADIQLILGKRPGELVSCKYADANPNGCGAGEVCKSCSALNIMLNALTHNIESAGESLIPIKSLKNETLSFFLSVIPYTTESGRFFFLTLQDMTDTLRKRELEQIFFHDILNTTGGISGILQMLENRVPKEVIDDFHMIRDAFDNMIEEIQFQRQLSDAESRKIECNKTTIFSAEFIEVITELYNHHEVGIGKVIKISQDTENIEFESDFNLLKRVVGNMVKNALEASTEGNQVIIGSQVLKEEDKIRISVKNETVIPLESKARIFYKDFSSKGEGRGLGTYSMKIIGETYLNGKVGFSSDAENGTIFYIDLPTGH